MTNNLRPAPRTQDEIVQRIAEVRERDSFMLIETSDLLAALDREHLLSAAMSDYVERTVIEADETIGAEPMTPADAHAAAIDYLPFAYSKAYGERGISAWRSLAHLSAWLWLALTDEAYARFDWEDYDDYGIDELRTASGLLGVESITEG